jgi:hypothetical protein
LTCRCDDLKLARAILWAGNLADFEDSGYGVERRTAHKAKHPHHSRKIATGVGIALACALAIAVVAAYRAQVASEVSLQVPKPSVRSVKKANGNATEALPRQEIQRAAPEQPAREPHREQQSAATEAIRVDVEPRQNEQPRASQAGSEVLDEKTRKEQVWAKFYKRPAYCDHDPTNEQTIKCANDFIRAQRQFHEAYTEGKL